MTLHATLATDDLHGPYRRLFADDAARTADAGSYTAADVTNRVMALQLDTLDQYVLTATTPVWTILSMPADPHTIASHSDTTATGAELETLTDGSNADALHTHASGLPSSTQVTATGDTTTTSPTYVLVDSMTITPGAGTWLVSFGSYWRNSTNGAQMDVTIFVNGVEQTGCLTRYDNMSSGDTIPCNIPSFKVTTAAAQAIEVRWKRSSGTNTMGDRHLTVTEVAA